MLNGYSRGQKKNLSKAAAAAAMMIPKVHVVTLQPKVRAQRQTMMTKSLRQPILKLSALLAAARIQGVAKSLRNVVQKLYVFRDFRNMTFHFSKAQK